MWHKKADVGEREEASIWLQQLQVQKAAQVKEISAHPRFPSGLPSSVSMEGKRLPYTKRGGCILSSHDL